jgi:ATP-dependent DNA ligase
MTPISKEWPILFKLTNTGAIQQWRIWTVDNIIFVEFGQKDGKLQRTSDLIKEGKNIGKVNETNAIEQAQAEAQSKWEKQKKKRYVESVDDALAKKVDKTKVGGGIPVMLAPSKIYPTFAKKLKWPVIVQPKLDGSRMIAVIENGECSLWSRTCKPINSLPHIKRAVEQQFGHLGDGEYIFDGEAYSMNEAQQNGFEGLMSLIRSTEPVLGHEVIEYWIYDLPSSDLQQDKRDALRLEILKDATGPIKCVPSVVCVDHEAVMTAFEKFLELGFEGAMVRSADGTYEQGKRSYFLQKLKNFTEEEFLIIDTEEGRGKDIGTVGAFVCVAKNGKQFKARLKASYERRRELFNCPEQWKNKKLTVAYQNLSFDNIPRFPIGRAIRDYE